MKSYLVTVILYKYFRARFQLGSSERWSELEQRWSVSWQVRCEEVIYPISFSSSDCCVDCSCGGGCQWCWQLGSWRSSDAFLSSVLGKHWQWNELEHVPDVPTVSGSNEPDISWWDVPNDATTGRLISSSKFEKRFDSRRWLPDWWR